MTPILLIPIPFALAAATLLRLDPKQDTPFWLLYLQMVAAGYAGLWVWGLG